MQQSCAFWQTFQTENNKVCACSSKWNNVFFLLPHWHWTDSQFKLNSNPENGDNCARSSGSLAPPIAPREKLCFTSWICHKSSKQHRKMHDKGDLSCVLKELTSMIVLNKYIVLLISACTKNFSVWNYRQNVGWAGGGKNKPSPSFVLVTDKVSRKRKDRFWDGRLCIFKARTLFQSPQRTPIACYGDKKAPIGFFSEVREHGLVFCFRCTTT